MLPEDKAEFIKRFKSDHPESVVAMVGDGINDTPAFSSADLSFVMGTGGADAALEHADIVLKSDNLDLVCQAISLGEKTVQTVRQNYRTSILRNGDETTSATMHHNFRPPLPDLKSQKHQNSLLFLQLL